MMAWRLGSVALAITGVKVGAAAVGAASLTFLGLALADSPHNSGRQLPARVATSTPTAPQIALAPPLNLPPPALPVPVPPAPHSTSRHATTHHAVTPTPSRAAAVVVPTGASETPSPSPSARHTGWPGFWHARPTPSTTPSPSASPSPSPSPSPSDTCGPRGCRDGGDSGHGGHHHGPRWP